MCLLQQIGGESWHKKTFHYLVRRSNARKYTNSFHIFFLWYLLRMIFIKNTISIILLSVMSSTRLLLLNCLLHYVQLQDHFYSYDSWKVKILLVGGDVISWITGLLHYNTRQFISLLNICGDINSWVRVSHEIPNEHAMMNPQYCWISRLTWTISRLRPFYTKNYSLSANN